MPRPATIAFGELQPSLVADPALAAEGEKRVAWARAHMPVLGRLRAELERDRPLEGRRIGMCLHVEAKTAVLVETLLAGGAEIAWTGSPATTDDGVAAAMTARENLRIYALKADDTDAHHAHIGRVLASDPDMLLDNGADLIAGTVDDPASRVFAATEETTSGRLRLTGELAGRVPFPVIVINDSPIKLSFESERGIGPAAVDGFFRATNTFIAGKTFAVVGFGWCGRSLARTLRAMGAVVIVVEIDPVRALEAAYEGMLVTTIEKAAARADTIITVTGRPGIVRPRALRAAQGRRDARQHGPLLDRDRRRGAARDGDRHADGQHARRGVRPPQRPARPPPRARRDAQPDGGDRPPDRGHGPRLRAPGALDAHPRRRTRRRTRPATSPSRST